MQPTVTDVPRSVCISPAKTAELIDVPFGVLSLGGTRNHALSGAHNGTNGKYTGMICVQWLCMSCAKMTEAIKMPFGQQTCVVPRNHVLDGRAHRCHLPTKLDPSLLQLPNATIQLAHKSHKLAQLT